MPDDPRGSGTEDSPTESGEFYRALVENASEGLLTIDTESRIVYANPAIEEILGYEPDELVGSSKMEIIPERLRATHASALRRYIETGERNIDWNGIELPALHKNGHEVPTLISLREHTHDGERFFTGIVRDVTERRARENALREQKERLDEFAGVVSHDIKNPLSIARGYTEIAREDADSPELQEVSNALERIDELTEDLLTLSREGETIGETDPVVLEQCVRSAWSEAATGESKLVVDADPGDIRADENRFRDLLGNLFRNAVEHGGDDVTVRFGTLEDRSGFYVEDDGPGIPTNRIEDVFEYGYTTNRDGTGYGLSIVENIATAHGWDVVIVDGSSGGARFEFTGVEFLESESGAC